MTNLIPLLQSDNIRIRAAAGLEIVKTLTDEQKRTREKMLRDGVNGYEVLRIILKNNSI